MSFSSLPDLEYLNKRLSYCPETGVFMWRPVDECFFATKNAWSTWNSRFANKKAGKMRDDGYLSLRLKYNETNKSYLLHRLAVKFVYGYDPNGFIDHINGIRSDNRIKKP